MRARLAVLAEIGAHGVVAGPDPTWGEVPVAFVTLKADSGPVTAAAVLQQTETAKDVVLPFSFRGFAQALDALPKG